MRVLDKLISFVFDVAIIVIAVAILLVNFNVVEYEMINKLFDSYVFNSNYELIVNAVCVVVILLAFKVTVFSSSLSKKKAKNIMVDTEHGRIQIGQNSIENIAKNVIKDYKPIKDVQAAMVKTKKGINLYMIVTVYQGVNIKDIISKVQADVKEQVEAITTVVINKVDVKIRNVVKIDSETVEKARQELRERKAEKEKQIASVDATESKRVEVKKSDTEKSEGYKDSEDTKVEE